MKAKARLYTYYGTLLTSMFSGLMWQYTSEKEWRYLRAKARLYTYCGTVLTSMFSGLMSRCTSDRQWRYLKAETRFIGDITHQDLLKA